MKLEKSSGIPLYLQLKKELRKKISFFKSEGQFLSEHTISHDYQVARGTAREALNELIREGYLYRVPGKGTFVKPRPSSKEREITRNISVLVPSLEHFFPEVVKGVEQVARKRKYTTTLCNAKLSVKEESRYIKQLVSTNHVGGLIFVPFAETEENLKAEENMYRFLRKGKIPFVFVDKYSEGVEGDWFIQNNEKGARQVVEYLLKMGHRKIAYIGSREDWVGKRRFQGYAKALKEYDIHVREELLGERVEDFLKIMSNDRPSAVFVSCDKWAEVLYKMLEKEGIAIPRDISIVGYDNDNFTRYMTPPLTTVNIPKYEMGMKATEILLDKIEGHGPKEYVHVVFEPEVIVRESVKPI